MGAVTPLDAGARSLERHTVGRTTGRPVVLASVMGVAVAVVVVRLGQVIEILPLARGVGVPVAVVVAPSPPVEGRHVATLEAVEGLTTRLRAVAARTPITPPGAIPPARHRLGETAATGPPRPRRLRANVDVGVTLAAILPVAAAEPTATRSS